MSTTPQNLTRAGNIPAVERATERSWAEIVAFLDSKGASKMSHTNIAALALELTPPALPNERWWAQAVAIAFEQHAGLRAPGQSAAGDFRVSVSRTLPVGRATALAMWIAAFGADDAHLGHTVSNRRDSETAARAFHRFSLEGAGKIEVAATPKDAAKTVLSISQTALDSGEQIEEWRAYWKAQLTRL